MLAPVMRVLTVATALVLSVLPASAGKRVALVIGNSAYAHAPALRNPRNDAADLAAALRDIGFEVFEQINADERGMREAVRAFSRALPGAEMAAFYYAGHGLQYSERNYLVPVDVKIEGPADVRLRTVDLSTIMEEMEAEERVNLIFLDACRDNPFAQALSQGRSVAGRGLARPNPGGLGTLIAFATQPGNIAQDGEGRNSPFTTALLKHIKTPGLEVRLMLSRVRTDVLKATQRRQVPWTNEALTGEVFLVPSAPGPAAVTPTAPSALAPVPGGKPLGLENGVDRPGLDYHNQALSKPDPASCQRLCQEDSRCRAFTYVAPGVQGSSARCWLKTGVPDAVTSKCCVSGVALTMLESGINRPGLDYRDQTLPRPDPVSCQRLCQEDSRCRAFTYVAPGAQGPSARCWLKTGVPDAVASKCCVSGVMPAP